jgi:DNA replication and repair protein RecF
VLITAAVGADVPEVLRENGTTYAVQLGQVDVGGSAAAAARGEDRDVGVASDVDSGVDSDDE